MWRYMKKHHQTCLKGILHENIHDFGSFWARFLYRKILRKGAISVIPGRTQTRISWARNWTLTFCKKPWHDIEKLFHTRSTCIFDPGPPYRLKILFWFDFGHCWDTTVLRLFLKDGFENENWYLDRFWVENFADGYDVWA